MSEGYKIFQHTNQELRFRINNKGEYVYLDRIDDWRDYYPWLDRYDRENSLAERIAAPVGYQRVPDAPRSFAEWLRDMPLKEGNPPVHLFNGQTKQFQDGHRAVVDIDVDNEDLQQCADAIIRLYAEYLYSRNRPNEIYFRITNGEVVKYKKWLLGYRPRIRANRLLWYRQSRIDSSYRSFRKYLDFVFKYAGTYSLSRQLNAVTDVRDMKIGDVFIQGGFPGHAVLVIDMAVSDKTGSRVFMLAQSFLPAQDVHILKNFKEPTLSPWYRGDFADTLYTPEWTFTTNDLRRF